MGIRRRHTTGRYVSAAVALLTVLATGCGSVGRVGIRNDLDYDIMVTTGDGPLQERRAIYVRAHETAHEGQSDLPDPGCRYDLRVYRPRAVVDEVRHMPVDTPEITDQVAVSSDKLCTPSSGDAIVTVTARK